MDGRQGRRAGMAVLCLLSLALMSAADDRREARERSPSKTGSKSQGTSQSPSGSKPRAKPPKSPAETRASKRAEARAEAQAAQQRRIAAWIKQLGSDDYEQRQQAQLLLAREGVEAFDALQAARMSIDVEVARRARYLVRSLQINWVRPGDSAQVRGALYQYGEQRVDDRGVRIDRLASFADGVGLPALCRIVRFDPSLLLSKQAALRILDAVQETPEAKASRRARQLDEAIGNSRRTAAGWVRAAAESLRNPSASLPVWQRLTDAERRRLDRAPEQTSGEIVTLLLRWRADLLLKQKRSADAETVVRQMLALLPGNRDRILNAIDWLMERNLHGLIDELAERFPQRIERFVILQYRLAESLLRRGDRAAAEQAAQRARNLQTKRIESHLVAAMILRERGLQNWSEQEMRRVIRDSEAGSVTSLRAHFLLSEMLHDAERNRDAAEVLKAADAIVRSERTVAERAQQPPLNRPPETIASRMHMFYALHFANRNDRKKQLHHLREGLRAYAGDIDLLIAMHRYPHDNPEQRREAKKAVDQATAGLRKEIQDLRQYADQAPNESTRNDVLKALAAASNRLAWLQANTEGDLPLAFRSVREALRIVPEKAAYLDTLAHCHAVKGEWEEAIAVQRKAVKREPHSQQLQRNLRRWERALDAR